MLRSFLSPASPLLLNIRPRPSKAIRPPISALLTTTAYFKMGVEAGLEKKTEILPVDSRNVGRILKAGDSSSLLEDWDIEWSDVGLDIDYLRKAANSLRKTAVPVAFPTETVYGLGADATNGEAVRGIFNAKQRPADNPLIVHVHSLRQLRALLAGTTTNPTLDNHDDPIPEIYAPLIKRFWPGPLTIILPKPADSPLAQEVTAGLETFGARMPNHLLALALIKLTGRPLAAPSANASTKPSPTTAEHVLEDLDGRIDIILDSGPCAIGLESTVVDGLSDPPAILRPGGISIDQIRQCPGWEKVVMGYSIAAAPDFKPRAPGMKYRHYAPKARVALYEHDARQPAIQDIIKQFNQPKRIGLVRTRSWTALTSGVHHKDAPSEHTVSHSLKNGQQLTGNKNSLASASTTTHDVSSPPGASDLSGNVLYNPSLDYRLSIEHSQMDLVDNGVIDVWDVDLGEVMENVARGLFSALRELDRHKVDVILVEGVDDTDGDMATAVMNRLRKAAEVVIK